MITKKEFMKDYKQMSSEEQKSYIERVDKWNEETFPQLMAQASSWMNVPVKEFNEGLKLVSAINRARPFVVAHRSYKSVEVVLNKMHALLNEVRENAKQAFIKNFVNIQEQGFIPLYTRDKLIDALHEVCGFDTNFKFITKSQMKTIQKKSKGKK